jgi:sugar-specific transcriptional regulator TrmB/pimeloyl-ACP methyl ester carboxylesterase
VSQKTIKRVLKDFGLTENAIEVYLLLAKHGALRGGEIAKQTKIDRSLVYRILKRLKGKGFVESTLESPTRFMAVSIEEAFDIIIRSRQEEALSIERSRKDLLEDWRVISEKKPQTESEKFVLIEGNKNIYPKMAQMINETKEQFSAILPISCLVRAEQFGVFDAAYNHPLKSQIKFQFVTELAPDELQAIENLKPKLKTEIYLKARNPTSSFMPLSRMVMKDEKEVFFFTRPDTESTGRKQSEVCIYTNCESLVQTFKGIFLQMWNNSVDIEDKIAETKFTDYHPSIPSGEEMAAKSEYVALGKAREKFFLEMSDQNKKRLSSYIQRIELLKEDERDILDCASVIGEQFSSEIVEQITGFSHINLLKRLNNIERKHKLIMFHGNVYRFALTDIQQIIYNKITPELRKEYHALIAKHLREANKDRLEEVQSELAHHYFYSDNAEKSVPLILKLAEKTEKDHDIFKAIEYYSMALEIMEKDKKWKEKRTRVLEEVGDICSKNIQHDKANDFYEKALVDSDNDTIRNRIRKKIRKKRIMNKNGARFAYFTYGEGQQTILFLGESWYFMPQISYFSQKYKVIAMDLSETIVPGKTPTEYTFKLYSKILKSIVDEQATQELYMVGSGLGGLLAIDYLAKNQGKVSKLALFATPLIRKAHDPQKKKKIDAFWAMAFQNPSWGCKKILEQMTSDFGRRTYVEDQNLVKAIPFLVKPTLLINTRIIMDTEVRPLLRKIMIPTLILQGEKSSSPKENLELLKIIPNSRVHIFKGAYFVTYKEADKFNSALDDFFTSGTIGKTHQ